MNTPVNFKIATSLKEKGFDNLSEWAYQSGKLVHDSRNKEHKNWNKEKHVDCTAPTIAEVVMWLYGKHKIWIYVDFYNKNRWFGVFRNKEGVKTELFDVFNSPTEAYEAAILYTLNNLL